MNESSDVFEELKNSSLPSQDKLILLCLSEGRSVLPDRENLFLSGEVVDEDVNLVQSFKNLLKRISEEGSNSLNWFKYQMLGFSTKNFLITRKGPKFLEYLKAIWPYKSCEDEGRYWGYPECCIKSFCTNQGKEGREYLLDASKSVKAVSVFEYLPCSEDCEKSKEIGEEVLRVCEEYDYMNVLNEYVNAFFKDHLLTNAGLKLRKFVTGADLREEELEFTKSMIERFGEDAVVDEAVNWCKKFLNSSNQVIVDDFVQGVKGELGKDLNEALVKEFGLSEDNELVKFLKEEVG